jgi:hypothetical protein
MILILRMKFSKESKLSSNIQCISPEDLSLISMQCGVGDIANNVGGWSQFNQDNCNINYKKKIWPNNTQPLKDCSFAVKRYLTLRISRLLF